MEELWHAVQKIHYLGDEEEQGRLAEVTDNADHGESHPR